MQSLPSRREHATSRRTRAGRILAECIVALALSAVAISAAVTLSRAALVLADEALLTTTLSAAANSLAERATADACTNTAASGSTGESRITTTWTDAISPPAAQNIRHRQIQSTLLFSPLATRDSATLTIHAAGVCPW